jgi:predicted peroxiredoxin
MRYLFIESRSEHESPDVAALFDLSGRLRDDGHDVTVFLVQNGVLAVGNDLGRQGIEVMTDRQSLVDRGLAPDDARCAGMPELVRLLMSPDVIASWH